MTRISINRGAIERRFSGIPLSGGGFGTASAQRLADRMAAQARRNASGQLLRERSGQLKDSVRPIVRTDPRTGATEIGVGSTAPYAGHLEHGTPAHTISARRGGFLVSEPGHPDPLRKRMRSVNHPGFAAKRWLASAVASVVGRRV